MLSLVIGGARSGKSRFAESLAAQSARVAYLATAPAQHEDAEMAARIAHHRARRPAAWTTIEEPLEIADAVERHAARFDVMLLDCLTLWLSNFCYARRAESEAAIHAGAVLEAGRLARAAASTHLVVVTNEIGYGLAPETALGRFFRDLQGWVNQDVARDADWVYQVVAGIPVVIKRGTSA